MNKQSNSSSATPELMAPVGNWEMCQAAVHNGADSIYLGMPGYNARGRTVDLALDELDDMIRYCHRYGVKVFIAFNILIFEDELEDVVQALRDVLPLAPDAFIVQDIGLARLIKQLCPEQVVHASTQMTVSNAEAIEITSDLDLARYVLARENSIEDMQAIRNATDKELEVFVHGALCVAYSGQCLTSEHIGGRSANRGQCAQACRLPYELYVDGEKQELGEKRYLVSPKDHCGIEDIERLKDAGIDSFKIEGRLKSPQFVAVTSRSYHQAIHGQTPSSDDITQLALNYSRGFFNGWFDGVNHQTLVDGSFSDHRGHYLGTVTQLDKQRLTLPADYALKAGDGVIFADDAHDIRLGSRVYSVTPRGKQQSITLDNSFEWDRMRVGMKAYLNDDPQLDKQLAASWEQSLHHKRIPLTVEGTANVGSPLSLTWTDTDGNQTTTQSEAPLEAARNAGANADYIQEHLSKLDKTCFALTEAALSADGNAYVPPKMLRQLKQQAVDALTATREAPAPRPLADIAIVDIWMQSKQNQTSMPTNDTSSIHLLLREMEQLDAIADMPVETVLLDLEHGQKYRRACETIRAAGKRVGLATTRILKPNENKHLKTILDCNPDFILVRNLGALHWLLEQNVAATLVGDFSLNASNHLTSEYLLQKGLHRLTPSYDLNQQQLDTLVSHSDPSQWEITVHQYMPEFHMEHCVFAAFMSNGTSFRDCGAPCERHRVELRDHQGNMHPLKADMECRNTLFSGSPQSCSRLLPDMVARGIRHFRVEALFESPQALAKKVGIYHDLIHGRLDAETAYSQLNIAEKYGVSEGQLSNARVWRDRKKSSGSPS